MTLGYNMPFKQEKTQVWCYSWLQYFLLHILSSIYRKTLSQLWLIGLKVDFQGGPIHMLHIVE